MREIESLLVRNLKDEELMRQIAAAEMKWMPLHSNESIGSSGNISNIILERKRDQASHFILRLAFCSDPEAARWFIMQECTLFK